MSEQRKWQLTPAAAAICAQAGLKVHCYLAEHQGKDGTKSVRTHQWHVECSEAELRKVLPEGALKAYDRTTWMGSQLGWAGTAKPEELK